MQSSRGFTLIELMIVMAIIAITAAIAIPGLIKSLRGSNERNASGSLKTLVSAEVDFRQNDRDANGTNDFYVADIRGLFYVMVGGQRLELIDVTVADADVTGMSFLPKAGFRYQAMTTDEGGTAYDPGTGRNASRFGFTTWPDVPYQSGNIEFILGQQNIMWKRDCTQMGTAPPTLAFPPTPRTAMPPWGPLD